MEAHAKFAVLWHLTRDLHINKSSFARSFDRLVTFYIPILLLVVLFVVFSGSLCQDGTGDENLLVFQKIKVAVKYLVVLPSQQIFISNVQRTKCLYFRHWATDHQIPFMCHVSLYDGRNTENTQPFRIYIHTVEILVSHSQSSALTESTTNATPPWIQNICLQRCLFTYRPKSKWSNSCFRYQICIDSGLIRYQKIVILPSGLIKVAIILTVITTQLWINQYFSAIFKGVSVEPSGQPI